MKWLILLIAIAGCTAIKPEAPDKPATEYNATPCDGGSVQVIKQAVFDDNNVFNQGEQVPVNEQGVIDFEKGTKCFTIINHIRK